MPERFKLLYSTRIEQRDLRVRLPNVPWSFVEPHADQAMRNHDQTLERLNERGGLAPSELLAVIEHRRYVSMDESVALDVICALLAARPAPAKEQT